MRSSQKADTDFLDCFNAASSNNLMSIVGTRTSSAHNISICSEKKSLNYTPYIQNFLFKIISKLSLCWSIGSYFMASEPPIICGKPFPARPKKASFRLYIWTHQISVIKKITFLNLTVLLVLQKWGILEFGSVLVKLEFQRTDQHSMGIYFPLTRRVDVIVNA